MSQKRAEQVAKRKKKLKLRQKAGLRPEIELKNPYASVEEAEADMLLMGEAIAEQYGEVPDDFVPPIFIAESGGGLRAAPWVGIYRDILLKKYFSLEFVEPRLKFNLKVLGETILEQASP